MRRELRASAAAKRCRQLQGWVEMEWEKSKGGDGVGGVGKGGLG